MARALGATLGALGSGSLPGPLDFEARVPPLRMSWVRRVAGANLWVWFTFDDGHVFVGTVTSSPPIPSE